jgi:hypothetical protein
MKDAIDALNEGNEEKIKGFNLRHINLAGGTH